jgi:hypothetical protein
MSTRGCRDCADFGPVCPYSNEPCADIADVKRHWGAFWHPLIDEAEARRVARIAAERSA